LNQGRPGRARLRPPLRPGIRAPGSAGRSRPARASRSPARTWWRH